MPSSKPTPIEREQQTISDANKLLSHLMTSFRPKILPGQDALALASSFDSLILQTLSLKTLHSPPYNLHRRHLDLSVEEGTKGIFFPTQITTNNQIINSTTPTTLQTGDLVKFSASLHLNYHFAKKTVSFVLPGFSDNQTALPIENKDLELLLASSEALIRKLQEEMRTGTQLSAVTESIKSFVSAKNKELLGHAGQGGQNEDSSQLGLVPGVLMHKHKQYVAETNDFIPVPYKVYLASADGPAGGGETGAERTGDPSIFSRWESHDKLGLGVLEEGDVYEVHFLLFDEAALLRSAAFQRSKEKSLTAQRSARNKRDKEELDLVAFAEGEGEIFCLTFNEGLGKLKVNSAKSLHERVESTKGSCFFYMKEFEGLRAARVGCSVLCRNGLMRRVENCGLADGVAVVERRMCVQVGSEGAKELGEVDL